jgi:hypothetical protein
MKYFLDVKNHNEMVFMIGEITHEKEGEIIAKGSLYVMKDHMRRPQLYLKNVETVFYNSFDTFHELLEFVSIQYDRKKNNSINNLKEAQQMYENNLANNKYNYITQLNNIKDKVKIQKKDYKHIEVLRDLAIQNCAFEDDSDYFISFDYYHLITTCKGETKKFRYDNYNLIDIDEFYNYLVNDLNVKIPKDSR